MSGQRINPLNTGISPIFKPQTENCDNLAKKFKHGLNGHIFKKNGTVQNGQDFPFIVAEKNATDICYGQWDTQRERGYIKNRKKDLTFWYFELTM